MDAFDKTRIFKILIITTTSQEKVRDFEIYIIFLDKNITQVSHNTRKKFSRK